VAALENAGPVVDCVLSPRLDFSVTSSGNGRISTVCKIKQANFHPCRTMHEKTRKKTHLFAVQRHSIFPDAAFLLGQIGWGQGANRLRRNERRHGSEHSEGAIAGELEKGADDWAAGTTIADRRRESQFSSKRDSWPANVMRVD
jgi:hypothetical protein